MARRFSRQTSHIDISAPFRYVRSSFGKGEIAGRQVSSNREQNGLEEAGRENIFRQTTRHRWYVIAQRSHSTGGP